MKWLRRLLTLLLLCGLPPYTFADSSQQTALHPFTATYKLSLGSLTFGTVNVVLTIDAQGDYHYQAKTVTTGLISILRDDEVTEISRGRLKVDRVIPSHYSYHHKRPKKHHEVDLTFKWPEKKVINRTPESLWTMSIQPGVQDKFSQQLALMLSLNRQEEPFTFRVADGGRLKTYDYLNQGSERVETTAGNYHSIRLDRQKNRRQSKATLWMAPELNYLPVKIVRHDGDNTFQMLLTELAWQPVVSNLN
ncbi:MAG: DUF3108 domain-containing protein [Chromatiales bacterium]|nr:DUF3108 domain-containing protein [Chromatiales bacterium]